MRNVRTFLFFLVGLVLFSGVASASYRIVDGIDGFVTLTDTGGPVPNVIIKVLDSGGNPGGYAVNDDGSKGTLGEDITDSNGYYHIAWLRGSGEPYTVEMSVPEGYEACDETSVLFYSQCGRTIRVNFTLCPTCGLMITKTANPEVIVPGPLPSCETEGKPISLTFKYTGGGCTASDNGQGKKASCSGAIDDTQPVDITAVGGKKGDKVYPAMPSSVMPGGEFTITPTKFKADSFIELTNAGGIEKNKIHTSCSQPLRVGDVFGSLTLVAFNNQRAVSNEVTYTYVITNNGSPLEDVAVFDDKLGPIVDGISLGAGESHTETRTAEIFETTTNTVTVTGELKNGQVCEASDTATVTVESPQASCADGKPMALVFEYTGESCDASSNYQNPKKFSCSGDPNFAQPVQTIYTGKGQVTVTPSDQSIKVGDLVTVAAPASGKKTRLKADTKLEIRQDGNSLQKLKIHTSCSQPLNVGDQFGSLILREFIPEP